VIDRALAFLLQLAFRRRRIVLGACAAGAVIGIALLTGVQFDSDVLHLLPQRGPAVQTFRTYLDAFGSLDRLYVMFEAPDGHLVGEYDEPIRRYVDALRALPEIASVDAASDDPGKDWSYLLDRQLLLLGPSHVGEALARLAPNHYGEALAAARSRLLLLSAEVKTLVREDPLDLLPLLKSRLTNASTPLLVDPTQPGYVSSDGRSRLVIARPVRPPFDTAFARALNARLDALAATLRASSDVVDSRSGDALPPLVVTDAGGYRTSAQSEAVIKRESIVNSLESLSAIVLLVVFVFRSVRPLVAVFLPIILAALLTIAIYGIGHPLSTAAAGSAGMLFGLGVDGTLLLYVMYMQQRRRGIAPAAAVAGLSPFAMSVAIGFTTTAATFLGVVPVDLPALSELGRVVGFGILACGAFTVLIVPALVPRTGDDAVAGRLRSPWLGRVVRRGRVPILVAAVVLTAVSGLSAVRLQLNLSVDRLEPKIPAVAADKEIVRRFNLPEDAVFAVAEGASLDALLDAHQRLLAALSSAGRSVAVSSPALLLPPAQIQEDTMRRVQATGIAPAAAAAAFIRASADAGFRADSFAPFVHRLPALLESNARLTLEGYESHGLGELISRFVHRQDGRFTTVAYVFPRQMGDLRIVEAAVRQVGPPLRLTGVALVNGELEERFRAEFTKGAVLGVAGVLVLLIVGFADLTSFLLAVLPTVLGILWSIGVLALARVSLDLFSVFALLMSVGIGVDYGVHFLHHHRRRPNAGVSESLADTAPAILMAGVTTILGFGSLVTSSYGPLRMLGLVTSLCVGACLLAALVVLPALLVDRHES
jgi:predicted RND superfamily exporter protein